MLRDKCSETFATATFAPPTFAPATIAPPIIAPAKIAPPTIAPATDAPKIRQLLRRYLLRDNCSADNCSGNTATTAPATDLQELLRGYATFAPPIIILSVDPRGLASTETTPTLGGQHIMGKHIRGGNVRAPRLISNGWVAGAGWEMGTGAPFRDKAPPPPGCLERVR